MQSLEQCGNQLIDKLTSGILTTAKKGYVQVLTNQLSFVFESSKQIKRTNFTGQTMP